MTDTASRPSASSQTQRLFGAGLAQALLLAHAGCSALSDRMPLADMEDKRLHVNVSAASNGSDGWISISLFADGMPLLLEDGVEATLNGQPMEIYHGEHGFAEPFYQPTFKKHGLGRAFGSILTIEISDFSQKLRVVISGYRVTTLSFGGPSPEIVRLRRGDTFLASFSGDHPDVAGASLSIQSRATTTEPCDSYPDITATLTANAVEVPIPATTCPGLYELSAGASFNSLLQFTTCENASCEFPSNLRPNTGASGSYRVAISQ